MYINPNKYDFFLFVQIMVLCLGNFGGALQASRALAILLSPLLLSKICKKTYKYAGHIAKILFLFYLYFLLSFFWTPDKAEAIKQLVYYPIHFILFLELIVFSRDAVNPLKSVSRGWLVAVLFCSAVAYWEITTGNHLGTAYQHEDTFNTGAEILQHMTASVTFYNYNSYVTFLCFCFPWIFFILLDRDCSVGEQVVSILALFMAVLVIVINASRGGLLTIILMLSVYFFLSKKLQRKRIMLILGVIVVGFYCVNASNDVSTVMAVMKARASDGGMFSGGSRYDIWLNVLSTFAGTGGFGVGIGGLHAAMRQHAPHSSITASHNMFLEILSQYGVVITLTIILFFCKLLKQSFHRERNKKIVLLMALLTVPIYTMIDSMYLLNAHLYAHIATIYIFANYELIRYHNPILRTTAEL